MTRAQYDTFVADLTGVARIAADLCGAVVMIATSSSAICSFNARCRRSSRSI